MCVTKQSVVVVSNIYNFLLTFFFFCLRALLLHWHYCTLRKKIVPFCSVPFALRVHHKNLNFNPKDQNHVIAKERGYVDQGIVGESNTIG